MPATLFRYYVLKDGLHYTVFNPLAPGMGTGRFSTRRAAEAYADKMIEADRELAAAAFWLDGMIVA